MSIFKPGQRPMCMDRTDAILTPEELAETVCDLSYEGLQMAAAMGLSFARHLGLSPAEIEATLLEMTEGLPSSVYKEIPA